MIRRKVLASFVLSGLLATGAYVVPLAPAATMGPVTDPIGVITVGPGAPLTIAYWLVTSGPDGSLGTDSRRGSEVATDDMKGRLRGHTIKRIGEDSGCKGEEAR